MSTKSKTNITMVEHLNNSGALEKAIADGNAMAVKLAAELKSSRDAFERLEPQQHPKIHIDTGYDHNSGKTTQVQAQDYIQRQIKRINDCLGDRV